MTDAEQDQAQPLTAHLLELRNRLLRSILVVFFIFAGLFYFANDIYTLVATPLLDVLPEGSQMIATEVASPFLTPFKMTLVVAAFIGVPYILFEVWGFIAPGLFKSEKRLVVPLLFSSVVLFYCGVAFAYFVVFPLMFKFFSGIGPAGVAYTPDIAHFLSTVTKLFFAFGVAFEIPIATIILIYTGATTAESLSKKRPYVIVGCFVVAMFLTPPDPLSQLFMALPMWLLFELGIFFGRFVQGETDESNEEESSPG